MCIVDQLRTALSMWLELSEVDPNAKSFKISMGGGMDSYTVYTMHKAIKEALELDPSNITGILMLDALSSLYFQHRHFSVAELMQDPARTKAYVAKAEELTGLIRSDAITAERNAFVSGLRTAVKMYGWDTPEVLVLLEDSHELAYLRRDAFRSIQQLRVDQFLSGAAEPAGTQPAYNSWVHQFWNVNSLIEAACRQPSGLTLNLIRDPDDMQSYFAFAIRNGGNLYLLSDVPVHSHPLQKYMCRRPDRSYDRRTAQNWFPYDLLNLTYDAGAKAFFADQSKRRSLVPLQQEVDKLKPMADLAAAEIVWTVMMFDLIVEKFWTQGYQAPALSYTGQMVREERPLIDAAETANLPVANYQTLNVKPLTLADMDPAAMPEGAMGRSGGSPNAWLEARYADKVDPAVLNLLDAGTHKMYLPPAAGAETHWEHQNHALAVIEHGIVTVNSADDEKVPFWNRKGRFSLHALGTTTFGTKEELTNNRLFLARYNQSQAIQRLADEEFIARKEAVLAWWLDRVKKNEAYLLQLAGQETVRRVFTPSEAGGRCFTADGYHVDSRTFNFAKVHTQETFPSAAMGGYAAVSGGYDQGKGKHTCVVTGAASSYRVLFQPQTSADLAELAGCTVSELPDVLQHWSPGRDHQGNHLLNRIDPMSWALTDPWSALKMRVVVFLSKRGLAHCKKLAPANPTPAESTPKACPLE